MRSRSFIWFVEVLGLVAIVAASASLAAAATPGFPQSIASGDPHPDSVVLWTRTVDATTFGQDLEVQLEVASDADLANIVATRTLTATESNDYCVKVRVDGLAPDTFYFYRFTYHSHAGDKQSPVGRTRTAPAAGSTRPVRFAVAYCQDYVGRYYNAYMKMLLDHDDDLDFVLFLGDYIYETTGDPSFQTPSAQRGFMFDDVTGAIPLGDPADPYYAAASLDNYRQVYRTYRSDPMLQQVHERWPMIAIWDDHEFSDDSWGATATYTDGRTDEYEPDRKRNAEQAFFEWVPTDAGLGANGTLAVDASVLYPNSRIYRDFWFGSMLHLVVPDYRTYRPDHLIPENAFPGMIVLDEPTLRQVLGGPTYSAVAPSLDPYVDVDLMGLPLFFYNNLFRQQMTLAVSQMVQQENPALSQGEALALAAELMHGHVSATFVNLAFQAAGLPAPFDSATLANLPRGLSYLYLGKQAAFSSVGSRYFVVHDAYNLLAAVLAATTDGAAENAYGLEQMAWLQSVLGEVPGTWNVLVSSVSMTPMVLDFSNPQIAPALPPAFPDELRTRMTLNVDQWDGFPDMRAALLSLLRQLPNAVVLSGDIHAAFVTDHQGVYEFTPPAISSGTFQELVLAVALSNPLLGQVPGIEQLVALLGPFLQVSSLDDVNVSPSDIIYDNMQVHGFAIIEAGPDAMDVTYEEIPSSRVATSYYHAPEALEALFTAHRFEVRDGQLHVVDE